MKPILFNTEMVKAILEGRKTVTRRVMKCQPKSTVTQLFPVREGQIWTGHFGSAEDNAVYEPPCDCGDILYVRETWQFLPCMDCALCDTSLCKKQPCSFEDQYSITEGCFIYKADDPSETNWKPSIHMPKTAARIFLRVVSIRAERIQSMTVQDVYREGVEPCVSGIPADTMDLWKNLWNRTLRPSTTAFKKYSWYANPWVWVIEFERCEKPEE